MLNSHFKSAGTYQALNDLGLSEMEKTAFWGALARLGSKALIKPIMHVGQKSVSAIAKPLASAGQGILGQVGRISPRAAQFLQRIGKGTARDAASFGLFSGALNAATAEPGNRLSAFGRGFAGGALGGAAWGMGSNVARMGLGRALGAKNMANLYRAGRHGIIGGFRGSQGTLGRGLKSLGAKAVTGGIPMAGALGLSSLMPTFEGR